jgi:hypothetical protein
MGRWIFSPTTIGGQPSCADMDSDGVAGIASLLFEVEQDRAGDRVPVSIVPTRDIDSPGPYEIALTTGYFDTRLLVDVRHNDAVPI